MPFCFQKWARKLKCYSSCSCTRLLYTSRLPANSWGTLPFPASWITVCIPVYYVVIAASCSAAAAFISCKQLQIFKPVVDIGHEYGLMCGASRHMIYGCLLVSSNEHGRLIAFRKPTVCLLAQAMSVRPINEFPWVTRSKLSRPAVVSRWASSHCYNSHISYYTSIIPATATRVFAWAGNEFHLNDLVAIRVSVATYVTDCLVFFKPDSGFALHHSLAAWLSVRLSDNIRHTSKTESRQLWYIFPWSACAVSKTSSCNLIIWLEHKLNYSYITSNILSRNGYIPVIEYWSSTVLKLYYVFMSVLLGPSVIITVVIHWPS